MGIFGALLDPIGTLLGAISPALGGAWDTLMKWTGIYYIGEFIGKNILEPTIKFLFGLEDEDIYEVDVVAVEMFQDDLYKKTQLDLVINYMKKESWDARTYATKFAETGDKQFGKFYRHGKWDFLDYLPEVRVTGVSINTSEIQKIIENLDNDKIYINDILITAPYDDDWCKWHLQEQYGYDYGGNFVKIDDNFYSFGGCTYDLKTNTFKVTLKAITKVRVRVYTNTSTVVVPASDTDIKKYTIRKGELVTENINVTVVDNILVTTLYEDVLTAVFKIVKTVILSTEVVESTNPKEPSKSYDTIQVTETITTETYLDSSKYLIDSTSAVTVTESVVESGTVTAGETIEQLSQNTTTNYIKYSALTRTRTEYYPKSDKVLSTKTDVIETNIEIIDEFVQKSEFTDTENITEPKKFFKITNSNKTVKSDTKGVIISVDETILSTEYVLYNNQIPYNNEYLVSHTTISENETERTTVEKETTYSSTDTGVIFSTEKKIISTTDKIVPIGTGNTSFVSSNDSDEIVDTDNTTSKIISVPNHNNVRYYSVYYSSTNTGRKRIWIYNPGTYTYPSLYQPVEQLVGFQCYPIVALRHYYFNIDEYNRDSKDGRARPSTISKRRYDATKSLMSYIGLDVKQLIEGYSQNESIDKLMECYFLIGVSPSNSSEIVSKLLYELFDLIADKMPYVYLVPEYKRSKEEIIFDYTHGYINRDKFLKTIKKKLNEYSNYEIVSLRNAGYISVDEENRLLFIRRYNMNWWNLYEEYQNGLITREEYYRIRELHDSESVYNYEYDRYETYDPTKDYDDGIGEYDEAEESSSFSIAIKEQAFNAALLWKPQETVIRKEVIGTIGTHKHYVTARTLTLKKQITPTETKTLVLDGVTSFTIVNSGNVRSGKDFDLTNKNLVLPVFVEGVERLSLMEKTMLLGNSMYLVFYAFQHTHLEWYQTEAFANAMQIFTLGLSIVVTIVITVVTLGSGTGAALTWSGALLAAFKAVAIGAGLMLAMSFIMNNVDDVKLKMLLGMVATAVAIYAGGGFSMSQSLGTTAMQLVQLCTTALNIYTQDMQQRIEKDMDALKNEAQDFMDRYTKRSEELSNMYESMVSGLSAENMVGLIDMDSISSKRASDDVLLLSPSQFYSIAIDAYRHYDVLYTGFYDSTVHKFHKQKLTLGIGADEGEE